MKTGLVLGAALVGLAWLPSASATATVASYPAGLAKTLPQGQVARLINTCRASIRLSRWKPSASGQHQTLETS
jgi:hypothetical protein